MNIAELYVWIDNADHLLYEASNDSEQTEDMKRERIELARHHLWNAKARVKEEIQAKLSESNSPFAPAP